jgi:hypothetical protein
MGVPFLSSSLSDRAVGEGMGPFNGQENDMGLKDALSKLNDAVKDLTSLHVQTYQGRVEIDMDAIAQNGFDSVREAVTAAEADPGGKVSLVAEAYYQFDGDSYNFLTSDDIAPGALDIHKAAVEAGIKTRQGLLELFKGLFD